MTRILAALALIAGLAAAAVAQGGLFDAAARVNGTPVTNWQVEQRALFLSLLRAPGADVESAREALIDEALQTQAAARAGIRLTPEELQAGLVEFAGRANFTAAEFVEALGGAGVEPETFRDFVRNGLLWRQLVQQRFGARARPTEGEVERVLARGGADAGVRVLLSEIALPLASDTQAQVRRTAETLSDTITSEAGFASAARRLSRAASARDGGRIDWIGLSQLPPPIAAAVLTLAPGEVSRPVNLGSFIGVFLLRGLEEGTGTPPDAISIDWAEYLIPGGRTDEALARAARLRAQVDTCDDLYGVAQGQPDRLRRELRPVAEIPDDLRAVLATLDEDEMSTRLVSSGTLRVVMLCGRVTQPSEEAFEALGQQLLNQRLTGYAAGYLDELRADAVIE